MWSNSIPALLGFFLCLFLSTTFLVKQYIVLALSKKWLDHPNHRSFHDVATPVGGGIVPLVIWVIGVSCYGIFGQGIPGGMPLLLAMLLVLMIMGVLDDHWTLSAMLRLHCFAWVAGVTVLGIGYVHTLHLGPFWFSLGWVGLPLSWLGIIWSINLYNFMDGSDGLSAVEGIFVFGVGAWLFWQNHFELLAVFSGSLAIVLLGFLRWNWPPAKIFLGDAGSTSLGYLVATFALMGYLWCDISILAWAILYMWFFVDSTLTLGRRIYNKQNWTQAHRQHAFHRLLDYGLTKPQLLWGVITLNVILTGIVIWSNRLPGDRFSYGVCVAFVLCVAIYAVIERLQPMLFMSADPNRALEYTEK